MNNKQAALIKLAQVRCAINHVLRMRAMQKQADMNDIYKSDVYNSGARPYDQSFEKLLPQNAHLFYPPNATAAQQNQVQEQLRQLGVFADMGYPADVESAKWLSHISGGGDYYPWIQHDYEDKPHALYEKGLGQLMSFDSMKSKQTRKPGAGLGAELNSSRHRYGENPEQNITNHGPFKDSDGNWHTKVPGWGR